MRHTIAGSEYPTGQSARRREVRLNCRAGKVAVTPGATREVTYARRGRRVRGRARLQDLAAVEAARDEMDRQLEAIRERGCRPRGRRSGDDARLFVLPAAHGPGAFQPAVEQREDRFRWGKIRPPIIPNDFGAGVRPGMQAASMPSGSPRPRLDDGPVRGGGASDERSGAEEVVGETASSSLKEHVRDGLADSTSCRSRRRRLPTPAWKSTSVFVHRTPLTKSPRGDGAAVLARSSGEEPVRHAIEQASRRWRGG